MDCCTQDTGNKRDQPIGQSISFVYSLSLFRISTVKCFTYKLKIKHFGQNRFLHTRETHNPPVTAEILLHSDRNIISKVFNLWYSVFNFKKERITMDTNQIIYEFYGAKAVPVVASFSKEGQVKPLYVRIENESVKILSTKVIATSMHAIAFTAIVVSNNIQRTIKLLYKTNENIWRVLLPKM